MSNYVIDEASNNQPLHAFPYKVSEPHLIIHLKQTPIFRWCVILCTVSILKQNPERDVSKKD